MGDGTVISSRSSISSVSPDSRVRRSTTSQFTPSELTAKRDVYDFKLKRDINARPQSGQLNAAKMVSKAQTNKAPTKTMSKEQKDGDGCVVDFHANAVRLPLDGRRAQDVQGAEAQTAQKGVGAEELADVKCKRKEKQNIRKRSL